MVGMTVSKKGLQKPANTMSFVKTKRFQYTAANWATLRSICQVRYAQEDPWRGNSHKGSCTSYSERWVPGSSGRAGAIKQHVLTLALLQDNSAQEQVSKWEVPGFLWRIVIFSTWAWSSPEDDKTVANQKGKIQRRKKNDRFQFKKKNPLNLDLMKTLRELTFTWQIFQIYFADHGQEQKKCYSPKRSLVWKQKLCCSKQLKAKAKMKWAALKSFQRLSVFYSLAEILLVLDLNCSHPTFHSHSVLPWKKHCSLNKKSHKRILSLFQNNTALFLPFFINCLYKGP